MFANLSILVAACSSQAGGGGSFGGGDGGGGGDSGWILEILFWLIRLAVEVPVIGVPLLIGAVVLFVLGARKGWWKHQERVIHKHAPELEARRSVAPLAKLRERDPNFDEARFLQRVRVAFEKAQSAWCAQQLEPLRPFVSDGVFERFSLQIAEQREHGWRQGMDELRVGRIVVKHVESGQHFDTLVVRIPFDANIDRRALTDGAPISGSKLPRSHFEECWSFVRRCGAKTANAEGLIEGRCPNCGAPLDIVQSAMCGSCQALVRSGAFDWVLTEITQASEWSAEDESGVRGLASFAERDPGLSIQLLEDRVSVAFWRWSAAERLASVDPLLRIADSALCERTTSDFAARAKVERKALVDRAVGSVRTLGLLAGDQQDLAVIEVIWDGREVEIAAGASAEHALQDATNGRRSLRRTLFVLARRAGVHTRIDETFTTSRCATCGAHDTGGIAATCPYCGAARVGDPSNWLVTSIVASHDAVASRLRGELAQLPLRAVPIARPSVSGLLGWTIVAARADGHIDPRERRAVVRLGERLGVSAQQIDRMLDATDSDESTRTPENAAEARVWLRQLCELALLDGTLHHGEQRVLRHAAESFEIPKQDLETLLATSRTELYRAAR